MQGPPPSTFLVFFHAKSAALSPEANAALDTAAAAIKNTAHPPSVVIAAGVDKGDNLALSEPRYQAVRTGLVSRGVREQLIARAPLPTTEAKTGRTGFQRVEIILAPKAQ